MQSGEGLDFYLVFLVVFCFRCFGGYRRLASATLMTLTDMLFSRCLDFATVVAASGWAAEPPWNECSVLGLVEVRLADSALDA